MKPQPTPRDGHHTALARFFAVELEAWAGNAPLFRVFWLHGVLSSSALILLYATTIYREQLIAEQILVFICGFYTLWISVSIWRCSLKDESFWSLLARHLTVAWAANTALILAFRQLELLILIFGSAGTGLTQ